MVLQVQAEIADLQGRRKVPVAELFLGPGKSLINPQREILVGFHLPVRQAHQASAFRRIMRAQGIALPILNVSVWLERKSERIQEVRIAVGPGGPPRGGQDRPKTACAASLFPGNLCGCPRGRVETGRFPYQPYRAQWRNIGSIWLMIIIRMSRDCLERAEMD